jgi:hypothetical protein
MKKLSLRTTVLAVSLYLICMAIAFGAMVGPAAAAEKIVEVQIDGMVTKLDKNGNEYSRLIVQETRKISGMPYQIGIPTMAFGAHNTVLKSKKQGDTVKLIVAEKIYNGSPTYTVLGFAEPVKP